MALSQTRLYNCWQLTNKESGHCQPSPPPPSFFLLLRSVGIYIYTFLSQRLGRWAMCLVLYIYNRPLHHHHHHQPSLNSNIDLPSRRRGPETPCVHPSLQRGKMRSTYTQREKSGRFETSKVCAASTFFLFCFVDDEKTRSWMRTPGFGLSFVSLPPPSTRNGGLMLYRLLCASGPGISAPTSTLIDRNTRGFSSVYARTCGRWGSKIIASLSNNLPVNQKKIKIQREKKTGFTWIICTRRGPVFT